MPLGGDASCSFAPIFLYPAETPPCPFTLAGWAVGGPGVAAEPPCLVKLAGWAEGAGVDGEAGTDVDGAGLTGPLRSGSA